MTTISRRLALLAAAAVGTSLAGCSGSPAARKASSSKPDGAPSRAGSPSSRANSPVTIGLTYTPNIQFAPFYAAQSRGYYSDAGLDVTLRHHGASESEFGALKSGDEDYINAGGDEMLVAHSSGTPVVDIATLYTEYPVALIVRSDSPIKSPADMKGKTIGTPGPYGETYYALLALLNKAGLSKDELTIKYIGFTQQAALAGNKVDGVMGYVNNDVVQFKRNGVSTRQIALNGGSAPPLVGLGLGAMQQTLSKRPARTAAFVAATMKGVDFMVAHPKKTVELSAEFIPTLTDEKEKKNARAVLDATIPLLEGTTGRNNAKAWMKMGKFMDRSGLVKHSVDVDDVFTNEFV